MTPEAHFAHTENIATATSEQNIAQANEGEIEAEHTRRNKQTCFPGRFALVAYSLVPGLHRSGTCLVLDTSAGGADARGVPQPAVLRVRVLTLLPFAPIFLT